MFDKAIRQNVLSSNIQKWVVKKNTFADCVLISHNPTSITSFEGIGKKVASILQITAVP